MFDIRKLSGSKKIRTDWNMDMKLLSSFPEPKDDVDRAFFQFRARNADKPLRELLIKNIVSLFAIPVFIVAGIINELLCTKSRHHPDAVFLQIDSANGNIYPYEDFFPEEIEKEYPDLVHLHKTSFPSLSSVVMGGEPLRIWTKSVIRHPVNCYYNLLVLVHLLSINGVIKEFNPKAIINYRTEEDSTSSLCTLLCETTGREYICFMHGDYTLDINACFFRFSKYYIFDERYKNLFKASRCGDMKYIVYAPPGFKTFKVKDDPAFDYTYYFDGLHDNIDSVVNCLIQLSERGFRCTARPHPRFSNVKRIRELFQNAGLELQNNLTIGIKDSIENTKCAIGIASTTLSQAYYAGCTIVIDDMANINLYNELKKKHSISLERPHLLLSNII